MIVLMFCNVELTLGVTKDNEKRKHQMYKLYDFISKGSDIIENKMGTYTAKSKIRN